MGSSNRHWPSMFKSKLCTTTTTHHQWLHGINSSIMSTGCQKPTYTSAPSSSSSSSDKSSTNSTEKAISVGSTTVLTASTSPTSSLNQHFFQAPSDLIADPFFFPVQQGPTAALPQGFCFPNVADQSNLLLGDFMWMNKGALKKAEDEKIKLQQQLCHAVATPPTFTQTIVPPSFSVPSPINPIQGVGNSVRVPKRSIVFINDACFEVAVGPFNVRETFGDDAILVHSSGLPILTDDWGVTLQPLQDGGFYYVVRSFTSFPYE
ncbi:unnamed protein product [Fraxinus pennsylvanica]|uniref:Uncharacterized protein n=1 Tax=Fraxinus pennsylvanica TaxID=56036 RepID=A0AAD1YTP2_9LAMI|nr:unnamed protein product [Fraxinus pennsylvanica]